MNKDIRWKQRYSNLNKALFQLEEAVQKASLSQLEKAGLIQIFEFSFELAWKTLKDYLEANGQLASSPKEVIRLGVQNQILENGALWLEALEKRNLMTHTYDESEADSVVLSIKDHYFVLIKQLKGYLENEYA
jgi:nucleotidyltransferase substrate binding protein (TIGR01987 family)